MAAGPLRRLARDSALLLCAAVAAYVVGQLLSRAVGLPLAGAGAQLQSRWARWALALISLDLSRLPALLAAAWVVAPGLRARPAPAAVTLVALTTLLDVLVLGAMGLVGALYLGWPLTLVRAIGAAANGSVVFLVFRRRRR